MTPTDSPRTNCRLFLAKFFPDFSSSDTVNQADLLGTLLEVEYPEGEEGGSEIGALWSELMISIYEEAMANYQELLVEDKDFHSAWSFVCEHFPHYSSSDFIARECDLQKILDKECDPTPSMCDAAYDLLVDEFGGDENNPAVKVEHSAMLIEIYEESIVSFLETRTPAPCRKTSHKLI